MAVFSLVVDDYLSARFLSRLLIAISITSLVAAGEALVIITRNIDLSVGSIVGVAAYLTAELLADHRGLPAVAAIAFALGVGAVLGVVNGILVAVAKVPSIIATLGTLSIYRSLLTDHAGGKTVSTGSLPAWIVDLPRNTLFRIGQYEVRTMFVLALVIAVVLHLVLQYVQAGRHLYALGSNPEAARQAGLNDAAHPDRGVHRCPVRWPAWPASCTSAASERSTSRRAQAWNWRRSQRRSSAASARWAARAPSSARSSARC